MRGYGLALVLMGWATLHGSISVAADRTASKAANAKTEDAELNLLFGQEPTGPARPAPRTADGHPDLSGYWKGTRATRPVGNIGKDLPWFKLPLTPAGQAALKHNLTATIDPESLCIIGGIPRHSASALPFEIVQNANRVLFLYMYTYFREIPVDGRRHHEDPDPTFFGDKIGKWEGDSFVIDTVGIKGDRIWIDENGNPQSDAMHVVERWTRPDYEHVHLELTVDDPKYYTRPFNYQRTWVLGQPGEILQEYACSENNIDREHLGFGPGTILPDGTRDNFNKPLPDEPPGPEFYEQQKRQQEQKLKVSQNEGARIFGFQGP
ncbi:MAG: hypothetical protein QM718_05785 [Steroidobacteraceae bacterium]